MELHSNQLTGEIPESLYNLTNLVWLLLSENDLSGSISSDIGNLTNLQKLFLKDNKFTGNIPESICNLNNVTWASGWYNWETSYIYGNNLCPPYPSCIEDYVGVQDTSECEYCIEKSN